MRPTCIVLLLFNLISPLVLHAQQKPLPAAGRAAWVAHLLRRHAESLRLPGLELTADRIPVVLAPTKENLRPLVEIKVRYSQSGWTLFAPNGAPMKRIGDSDDYSVSAYLLGRVSEVTLFAVGPDGQKKYETIYIYAPEAKQFKFGSNWHDLTFYVGLGELAYQQRSYGLFESITGSIGLQYLTPVFANRYSLLASGDMSILTFKSSPINSGPQILEGKIDGLLNLDTSPEARTRYQLMIGADYLTMIANGSPFGFSNLLAPELGLRGTYVMDPVTNLIGEARYVAIGRFHGSPQFGIDLNLTWVRQLPNAHKFKLGLGLASYTYTPSENERITIDLLTLRLGYTL